MSRYQNMARAAIFAALLAILSQIAIPTPGAVPVTLQIFAVALSGRCLGPLYGTVSTLVYLLLGAVGVPVFSGFSGGISALFSYTGGFLLSFPVLAAFSGLRARRAKKAGGILLALAGLSVCHLVGVAWYSVVSKLSFAQAFVVSSLPYLGKDALLVLGTLWLAEKLKRRGIASRAAGTSFDGKDM